MTSSPSVVLSWRSLIVTLFMLVSFLAGNGPLHAQARIEITPYVASYLPISKLKDSSQVDTKVWQSTAPMIGASMRERLNTLISIEGGLGYAFSGRFIEQPSGLPFGDLTQFQDGYLLVPSAKVLLTPRRSNFYGSIGIGMILRRGNAWPDGLEGRDDIAAVIGMGVRAEVTSRISLRADAEVHLYQADPDGDVQNSLFAKTFQQDVVVRVAVPIGLFRR